MIKLLWSMYAFFWLWGNPGIIPLPNKIQAKVISVKDGDTIEILYNEKPIKIRLAHIDCPEIKKGQPFGKAAKQFTSGMCFGRMATIVHNNKFDRYRRLIAVVENDKGQNLNKELVKAGLAWHFKKYSPDKEYDILEEEARRKRMGLWADKNPIAPWLWRTHRKNMQGDNIEWHLSFRSQIQAKALFNK